MMSRFPRFNAYLLLAGVILTTGCKTAEERDRDATVATLRLHLEVNPDETGQNETVEISGVSIRVNKSPFLDEGSLEQAAVVDTRDGGFAIQLQYNRHGTLVLDNVTTEYRGRHYVVFAQFGVHRVDHARWLAAPLIGRRIANGYLIFTPNVSRDEAGQLALGLSNVIRKIKKRSRF